MAHIHLEDGSFSLYWVIVWWICALAILGISLFLARSVKNRDPKKIILAAFITAAAFAVFQVDIPIFGGIHLSLMPLVGILTGPVIGSLIVLIVNILSAAIGHGGWSLIGANLLVNFSEVLVAYSLYRGLKKVIPDLFSRAALATFLSLFVGNIVMIGIVVVSGVQGSQQTSAEIFNGLIIVAAVNIGVAIIEAVITGLVIRYIGKVRPDILDGGRI